MVDAAPFFSTFSGQKKGFSTRFAASQLHKTNNTKTAATASTAKCLLKAANRLFPLSSSLLSIANEIIYQHQQINALQQERKFHSVNRYREITDRQYICKEQNINQWNYCHPKCRNQHSALRWYTKVVIKVSLLYNSLTLQRRILK